MAEQHYVTRDELRAELAEMKVDLIKWMVGTGLGIAAVTATLAGSSSGRCNEPTHHCVSRSDSPGLLSVQLSDHSPPFHLRHCGSLASSSAYSNIVSTLIPRASATASSHLSRTAQRPSLYCGVSSFLVSSYAAFSA